MLMSEKKKKCMTKIFGLLLSVINPPHILSFFLWFGIFAYLLYVIYMLGSAPGVTLKKLIFLLISPLHSFKFSHSSYLSFLLSPSPLLPSLLLPLSTCLTSFSLFLHPSFYSSFFSVCFHSNLSLRLLTFFYSHIQIIGVRDVSMDLSPIWKGLSHTSFLL